MFIHDNKFARFFILLLFTSIGLVNCCQAQELQEEEEWVPSMLQAKNSTYLQLMQYGGFGIGWKFRGLNEPVVSVLNGIIWDSKSLGITLFNAMSGINSLTKTQTNASFPFLVHNANINASAYSKQLLLGSRFDPINGRQYNQFLWSSGLHKQSWASIFKLQEEKTFIQNPALGKRSLLGIAWSAEKFFPNHATLGFSFWYNDIEQTKQSPTVMEAIRLSGNTIYHPGWGWYNGQLLFTNARQSNLPMAQIQYLTNPNAKHFFQISWGLARGNQSEDGLDWNATKDPRPDYYKYLPSYYKDSLLQQKIITAFRDNPSLLQLDFDQMKKINQSNKEGRAYYIISRENSKINVLQQAIQYQYTLKSQMQIVLNANTAFYTIEKSNSIANLLGGKYYLNYNNWVNDDGVDAFQYNLREPDQKVLEGASWGAHYTIHNLDQQFGFVGTAQFPNWEYTLGAGYGFRLFQREGFNQNGLYPYHSIGKSTWYKFPSSHLQWQSTYKYSPRVYFNFNTFSQQVAPVWREAFVNIALQDKLADFLLPVLQSGIDLGFHYLGIYYRTDWHLYHYWQKNKMGNTSFYHDYYNAFVQGSYGLLHTNNWGLEGGLETNFNALLNFQLAFSWSRSVIMNNPVYAIQLLNNAYPLESGNLHLQNLPASSSPPIVLATGVNAQLTNSFRVGFTTQIGWNRYMELDYYRRSFLWEKKYKEQSSAGKEFPLNQLSNGLIANLFCNKNFQFKTTRYQHRVKLNILVNNIFNVIIPLLAYEQTRFDYQNFQLDKFAPKYILGRPLNGSLQLIYQLN